MESPDNTHKTAIRRRKMSNPAKVLMERGLILKPALDYGCGYRLDAKLLEIEGYDKYHSSNIHWFGWNYKTILCTYVLNTLSEPEDRQNLIKFLHHRLDFNGKVYITVRNDIKNLNGRTSTGTWQGLITLPFPIIFRNNQFTIYVLSKGMTTEPDSDY